VFSILAQSYSSTGKGFNSVKAGDQNNSNTKYEWEDFAMWRKDSVENTPFRVNIVVEEARVEELYRRAAATR
jgi:hypothetical protein